MSEPPPVAYADESFHEARDAGFYVVAAAVLEGNLDQAREAMLALRGARRVRKAHWTEMDARQRKAAAAEVADLSGLHLVAVGSPVPVRRQERARAKCLHTLVGELYGYGVRALYCEARTPELNRRDVRTVVEARRALPAGARFDLRHVFGDEEPLLWVADVVAGAVRSHRQGEGQYRQIIEERIYEIAVDTGC